MSFRSTAVQEVLDRGQFCAVAAMTPRGPHCTPLVFASSGARLWLTTSRRSVKARAWRTDPAVSGLVRSDDLAVTFTGTVRTYDALDRRTGWANLKAVKSGRVYFVEKEHYLYPTPRLLEGIEETARLLHAKNP